MYTFFSLDVLDRRINHKEKESSQHHRFGRSEQKVRTNRNGIASFMEEYQENSLQKDVGKSLESRNGKNKQLHGLSIDIQ